MSTSDLWQEGWQEGQYDGLAKISPELRAQLARWAPKGPRSRGPGSTPRAHHELAQLAVALDCCGPRLA
jgi:hypothetical protein